ncbi:hypothetical protein SUDANB105_07060 [Streptomyces sp. enrichment culture]
MSSCCSSRAANPSRAARSAGTTPARPNGWGSPPDGVWGRIRTHSAHRRRGLARRVVAELEREALARGYRRVYLTTGPRQPEARGLYLATGYTPLFDTHADPETIGPLPFEKHLPHTARTTAATGKAATP